MKNEENIGSQNPIQESLQKIRIYFTYPNDPLTTETNWYHILRARLRWLNLFHPYNKGMRIYKFYYFFKCYLTPMDQSQSTGMWAVDIDGSEYEDNNEKPKKPVQLELPFEEFKREKN